MFRQIFWSTRPHWVYKALQQVYCFLSVFSVSNFGSDFPVGSKGVPKAASFFESYLSAIIVLVMFVIHRAWDRSSPPRLDEVDIRTGVRIADEAELETRIAEAKPALASKPFWYRFYRFWC